SLQMSAPGAIMKMNFDHLPIGTIYVDPSIVVKNMRESSFELQNIYPLENVDRQIRGCIIPFGNPFYLPIEKEGAKVYIPTGYSGKLYEFHMVDFDRETGFVEKQYFFTVETGIPRT
ncbi:hypothetical protein PENTCL1PPCAC_22102, partial [Pristionchus entomophagus]